MEVIYAAVGNTSSATIEEILRGSGMLSNLEKIREEDIPYQTYQKLSSAIAE